MTPVIDDARRSCMVVVKDEKGVPFTNVRDVPHGEGQAAAPLRGCPPVGPLDGERPACTASSDGEQSVLEWTGYVINELDERT